MDLHVAELVNNHPQFIWLREIPKGNLIDCVAGDVLTLVPSHSWYKGSNAWPSDKRHHRNPDADARAAQPGGAQAAHRDDAANENILINLSAEGASVNPFLTMRMPEFRRSV